ncbi:tetraspanin Tsp3 [Diplocarpon rosae]|nr:tetraspanin Tsp3 [Diplocarpon rosae]
MSTLPKKLAIFAIPLLLLALTATAGYAYSQIRSLSLPIPRALALFTVVLPFITGISARGSYGLVRRSANVEPYQLTIPLIAVIGFQLIYETIIATLALTHILPPIALNCGLQSKWLQLHRVKDADAIRAIQDTFACCGLNTVRDHSWPFTEPPTCASVYSRSRPCIGAWRKAEQTNAGLLLLVAITVFIIKVLILIGLLTNGSFTQWARHFKRTGHDSEEAEEDNRATMRRLIEENAEDYHDEPNEEPSTRAIDAPDRDTDHSPIVLPSQLTHDGHEWRT